MYIDLDKIIEEFSKRFKNVECTEKLDWTHCLELTKPRGQDD